ncbi:MAG TPA: 50S ribosomal protein L9 [Anaerolineales bacterium]|nr:50S ribosomal protein L9 [Anaerolineales bacterium]
MRVLLLKDVYKLGRAGDVKKVADGFGRNYLLPQGLAVLATPGAMKQADRIRTTASELRTRLNQEMSSVAERLTGLTLTFPAKAGETGKLYGSITTAMLAEAIERETGSKIDRRQIDSQPLKTLGVHKARVRLTVDLIPELSIVVHREGEPPESAYAVEVSEAEETFTDLRAELEAEAEQEVEQDEPEGESELEAQAGPDSAQA